MKSELLPQERFPEVSVHGLICLSFWFSKRCPANDLAGIFALRLGA
jgi:hypothetical protein